MLIKLKNKDTLIIDDYKFRCCIGKNGVNPKKTEGDKSTPKGKFSLGKIYYRADRVLKPETKIPIKIITKKMGWCDDPKNKNYNNLLVINFNIKKRIPYKGSAIFLHITKNFKPTLGCVAIKKKDFLILAKLINKNTKILIS